MDYLSIALNSSGIGGGGGGYLGAVFLNHLCYMLMIYALLACPPMECSNC